MNNILSIQHISKSYGPTHALKDVSFDVKDGEIVSILGPSGCGKSTLLQVIAGLIQPDQGCVYLDGKTVADKHYIVPPEKRPVNMVFQDYALWPHMTVYDNISFGLKKKTKQNRTEKVEQLLSMLRLDGEKKQLPSHLSGGQQQRVGIARALATEPKLLLMDEPLSNLDVKLRMMMRNELSALLRTIQTSVVHVTHDPLEAFVMADRLLMIREGQIEQFDNNQQVFNQPNSPWVAQLLGYTNTLSTNTSASLEKNDIGTINIYEKKINGVIRSNEPNDLSPQAGPWQIIFHPEDVQEITEKIDEQDQEKYNIWHGQVHLCIFEGIKWRIFVRLQDNQEITYFSVNFLPIGKIVAIRFPIKRTFLFRGHADD